MSNENESLSSVQRYDNLLIPVDGETVAATRYEPTDIEGPAPVLLMHYPYRKDDHLTFGAYSPTIQYFVKHGYEVVVADLIGTGASSGRKERPGEMPDEGIEGAAIVEWLASQPWTSGRVGMFGKSYAGGTCLKTAAQRPDGLEAIIPMFTSAGGYPERYGGVSDAWGRGGHWNPQMQALQGLPSSFRDDDGRWADIWKEHLTELEEGEPWLFQSLEHEYKDEHWDGQEVAIENIEAATFGVSGWRDIAPGPTLDYIQRINAPKRGLLGPFRHTMPHRGREIAVDFRRQAVEWFDYFLRDVDNNARSHATIEYWTERNGGGKVDEGVWRRRESWPDVAVGVPNKEKVSMAFTPDGLENTSSYDDGVVTRHYEHDHTVGMHSLDEFSVPADTGEDDVRSLCFETDPLESPVEYTGNGMVTVRLSSTVPDPLLVTRVVDVAPDGSANLVSHGRLRLSHRESHSDPHELEPGEEYEVTVPLKPKSHVFETGHQIRLAISAAYFPVALPTRKQGMYTIFSDPDAPSTLEFPGQVHEDDAELENTMTMNGPDEEAHPVEPQDVLSSYGTWSTSREHVHDRATVQTSSGKLVNLPFAEEMTFEQDIEAHVEADDPTSMYVYSETEMTIDYGTETAKAEITCRTARDSTQYTTTITMADQTVFEKTFIK